MQSELPKLNTFLLLVIAVATTVIAITQLRSVSPEEKRVYIDAQSGKVYEQPSNTTFEGMNQKLRREHPDGRVY